MANSSPPIHHWLAGDAANAERMNEIRDQINFLRNPPMVHVARTITTQALTTSAWTFISFDTVVNSYDPYGMFDAGAPTRVTSQVAGWYTVEGQFSLNATNTEGRDILGIYRNGMTDAELQMRSDVQNFPSFGSANWSKEFTLFLNTGDYLHLGIWYDSDASRTSTASSASERFRLRARWVSD